MPELSANEYSPDQLTEIEQFLRGLPHAALRPGDLPRALANAAVGPGNTVVFRVQANLAAFAIFEPQTSLLQHETADAGDVSREDLEGAILDWARLRQTELLRTGARYPLSVVARSGDPRRTVVLAQRGLQPARLTLTYFERQLDGAYPATQELPEGMSWADPLTPDAGRAWVDTVNDAFPSAPFMTVSIRESMQSSPRYRSDLDLMLVDSNLRAATLCTFWLTAAENGSALAEAQIEPVATHSAYRGRGLHLARAAIRRGFQILEARGIGTVTVRTTSELPWARHTYDLMGFSPIYESVVWLDIP